MRYVLYVCVALMLVGISSASIEKEPIKVTNRNSGPRYDIDDVERTKLDSNNNPEANQVITTMRRPDEEHDQTPVGQVTIRRILLIPVMANKDQQQDLPSRWSRPQEAHEQGANSESDEPRMFSSMRPMWPFMPPIRHHMLGTDEASRSPTPEASQERPQIERQHQPPPPPPPSALPPGQGERESQHMPQSAMIDPIQMMVDLMRHAIMAQSQAPPMMPSERPADSSGAWDLFRNIHKDLNKEQSGAEPTASEGAGQKPNSGTEIEFPKRPTNHNETREDIVEIEGKKYLRKMVVNRKVGDNIIFMTRRLIFVPLNETETENTTTMASPSTTTPELVDNLSSSTTTTTEEPKRKAGETVSEVSSPTNTITTGEPSTPPPVVNQPVAKPEEPITPSAGGSGSSSSSTTTTTTDEPKLEREETTPKQP